MSSKKQRKRRKPNSKNVNKIVAKNSSGSHRLKSCILPVIVPLIITTIVALIIAFVQYRQSAKSDEKNRELITINKTLIESNRGLLENLVTDKYEVDLQNKYSGGYTLFGLDHSRTFKNQSIPHKSNLLEEYEFTWDRVEASEVTETDVTIEMPHIYFKPLKATLRGTAMTIPKKPKGKSHRYPLRLKGANNRIFVELVEDSDSFFVFAIGFKPEIAIENKKDKQKQ